MDDKKKIVRLGTAPEEEVPDFYVNQVRLLTSQYELLFRFGLKSEPEEEPKETVHIRMSLQHAKVLTLLLMQQIRSYEKDIGEIKLHPNLIKELGINEKM